MSGWNHPRPRLLLTRIGPAKTLGDLPGELLVFCHDALLAVSKDDPEWVSYYQLVETEPYGSMQLKCLMLRTFGLTRALRVLVIDLLITCPEQQKPILTDLLDALEYSGHVQVYNGRLMIDDHELCPAISCIRGLLGFNKQLHEHALQQFLSCMTLDISFERTHRISLAAGGKTLHLIECRGDYFTQDSMRYSAADMLPLIALLSRVVVTITGLGPKTDDVSQGYAGEAGEMDLAAVAALRLLPQIFPQLEELIVVLRPVDLETLSPGGDARMAPVVARGVESVRVLAIKHQFVAFSNCLWDPMIEGGVDVGSTEVGAGSNGEIAAAILSVGGRAVRVL